MKGDSSNICSECFRPSSLKGWDDYWSREDEHEMIDFLIQYGLSLEKELDNYFCDCDKVSNVIEIGKNCCFNWISTGIPLDINNC